MRPPGATTRAISAIARRGIADVVQRREAVHEVERAGDERQRLRVALLQQHVVHACRREPRRAELEQRSR